MLGPVILELILLFHTQDIFFPLTRVVTVEKINQPSLRIYHSPLLAYFRLNVKI